MQNEEKPSRETIYYQNNRFMYFFLITIVFSTETKFTYSVGDASSSLKTKTFELKHNMWSSARLHESVGTGNFSAILSARKHILTIAPNSIYIACPTVTPQSWTQHIGMALLNFQLLRRYYRMYICDNYIRYTFKRTHFYYSI